MPNIRHIGNTFFRGLIAIIPLTVTLYLLIWLAGSAELALENVFKFFLPDSWYVKGFGLILGLALVFLFGTFLESRTFLGLFRLFEGLVAQIPVINGIYTGIRDISSLFSSKNKGKFDKVVLVNTPYGNGSQIGFITVSDFGKIEFISDDHIAVFLPFSYQMGGTTVIIPRQNVVEIGMSVEAALRFIATAGVVGNVTVKQDDKNGQGNRMKRPD
jgi:uncharacterized membrane protein